MSELKAYPEAGRAVIALISHVNDLGFSYHSEVCYHNGTEWCSYSGSSTFEDGERVEKWFYVEDVWNTRHTDEKVQRLILEAVEESKMHTVHVGASGDVTHKPCECGFCQAVKDLKGE